MGTLIRNVASRTVLRKSSGILFLQKRQARVVEVGKLEQVNEPKKQYKTGQFFLHKVFAYRGAVLFQWPVRFYDRDKEADNSESGIEDVQVAKKGPKNGKSEQVYYYQVLIDTRDSPHIAAQTESVTFFGGQETSRSIYAIPGLDYAAHDDILPFRSSEKIPLRHELFEKFLLHSPENDPPYVAQDTLKGWEKKNHPWLELTSVHRQTTENIRVTAMPFFMGTRVNQSNVVYWWRYCIRVENMSSDSVTLRERHWRIFSLSGTLETIRGRGVVGQEPIFNKSSPSFQYSSHVSLQAPNGHMWGTFRMERRDGSMFDVKIPPFSLESKAPS